MARGEGGTARAWGAERWRSVESGVTKAALLGVFCLGLVAQFVQPVGDALEGKAFLGGALLSLVAFVLFTEVRRLNEALRPQAGDEVSARELPDYFGQALAAAERTQIDAIGFTGETVVQPALISLEALAPGRARIVTIRILVPDFTVPMGIPGMLDEEGKAVDDPLFRAALLAKVHEHARRMDHAAQILRRAGLAEVDTQFRVLRITPLLKFCLINGQELFDGIYDKVVREPSPTPPEREILDLKGYQTMLRRWHLDSDSAGWAKVTQRKALFESLWSLASPLSATPAS
ncbi:hypothetical protein [Streptomyces flavofungini]|uniref:hypothetical protein n=1 Tax=Streptomyces flavofungini TaxID=68200 RepID=UPI0034DE7C65